MGNDTFIPTLLNYPGVSWIQDQSPALLYGWPKLPLKRKFGSVARKKIRFKLHMFQNSKIPKLSGLCLYYSFWLHFPVWMHIICCKQKEESFFFVTPIKMRVSGWVFNQLKSLTDRLTFFPQNCLWGGGEGGSKSKKNFRVGRVLVQKKSPDLRSPEVGISDDIICLNTICPLSCNYNSFHYNIIF